MEEQVDKMILCMPDSGGTSSTEEANAPVRVTTGPGML